MIAPSETLQEKRAKDFALLGGLFAIAAIVRLIGFDSESIWHDELISLRASILPLFEMIGERLRAGQGPLYFVVLKLIRSAGGESRAALLYPNIFFGAAAAPLSYLLARSYRLSRGAGVFAAILVALSPMLVDHSQELRPYPLTLFFFLMTILVWRAAPGRIGPSAVFGPVALLFGLCHGGASIMLAALTAATMLRLKTEGRRVLYLAPGFAFAGFILLGQALSAASSENLKLYASLNYPSPLIGWAMHLLFASAAYSPGAKMFMTGVSNPLALLDIEAFAALPLLASLFIAGGFKKESAPDKPDSRTLNEPLILLVFFWLIAIIAGFKLPVLTQPKYLMYAYPLIYLVVASSLDSSRFRAIKPVSAALIVGLFISVLIKRVGRDDLPQWKMAAELAAEKGASTDIYYLGSDWEFELFNYYYEIADLPGPAEHGRRIARLITDDNPGKSPKTVYLSQFDSAWRIEAEKPPADRKKPGNQGEGKFGLTGLGAAWALGKPIKPDQNDFAQVFPKATTYSVPGIRLINYRK